MLVGLTSVITLGRIAEAKPASSILDSLEVRSRCVTRERIAAAISRQRGGNALDPRITVAVEDDADLADVSVISIRRDGEIVGERRIGPLPCGDRSEAVAMALLVAVEAVLVLPAKASPPREEPPVATAAQPTEPAAKSDEAYPRLGGSLQLLGLVGVVPRETAGAAAALEISLARRLDARLSAAAALPTRSEVGPGHVDVTWISGRLDACAVAPQSSVRLRACAGTAFGALLARGAGFSPSYSAAPAWIAGMLRGDARVALSGTIGLLGSIEAVIPFVRPDLEIASVAGVVSERLSGSVVGGIVGVGIDFR